MLRGPVHVTTLLEHFGSGVCLQSPLVLCRHQLPKSQLWLLQPQSSRFQDSARRAMSNFLTAQPELLEGKAVLELNAGREAVCECL